MNLKTITRKIFYGISALTEESKPEIFLTCAKDKPLAVVEN